MADCSMEPGDEMFEALAYLAGRDFAQRMYRLQQEAQAQESARGRETDLPSPELGSND